MVRTLALVGIILCAAVCLTVAIRLWLSRASAALARVSRVSPPTSTMLGVSVAADAPTAAGASVAADAPAHTPVPARRRFDNSGASRFGPAHANARTIRSIQTRT